MTTTKLKYYAHRKLNLARRRPCPYNYQRVEKKLGFHSFHEDMHGFLK